MFDGTNWICTSSVSGKWVDGTTSGDIVYTGGNVGIGTDSPNAKLEVNGEIIQTGSTRRGYTHYQDGSAEKLYHYLGRVESWCGAIGVEGQFESHDTTTRGTGNFDLSFARRGGLKVNGFASGLFGESLDIELYETEEGKATDFGLNLDVYLVTGIYAMTNINISQTPGCGEINTAEITPQEKSETSHDGEEPYYKLSTDGAALFTDVNGNIGIGTQSPDAKLDVEGAIQADKFIGEASIYTHKQDITTSGAVDVEYFILPSTRANEPADSAVAFVNADGTVTIHRFNYSASGVTYGEFEQVTTATLSGFTNPNDAEVFQELEYDDAGNLIAVNETYLMVGDDTGVTPYKWNDDASIRAFEVIANQETSLTGHADSESFSQEGRQILAMAHEGGVMIREWSNNDFSTLAAIEAGNSDIKKLHFFEADFEEDEENTKEAYLAVVANSLEVKIYQWQIGEPYDVFKKFKTITYPNITDAHYFNVGSRKFLMISTYGNTSTDYGAPLYEWTGSDFEIAQTLEEYKDEAYEGFIAAKNFALNGTQYLVLATEGSDTNNDHLLFYWYEDGAFQYRQSIVYENIPGDLTDIEYALFGSSHRLIMAEGTTSRVLRLGQYNNTYVEDGLFVGGKDIIMSATNTQKNTDGISYNDGNAMGGSGIFSFHADQEHRPGWDDPGAAISAKGGYFAGKVGIGTTSPDAHLEIDSKGGAPSETFSTTASNASLSLASSDGITGIGTGTRLLGGIGGSEYAWFQAQNSNSATGNNAKDISLNPIGGKVGIGTTSPGVDLDIRDNGNTGLRLYNTDTTNSKYAYLQLMTQNYTDTGDIGSEGLEIGLYDTTGTAYIAREVNGGIKSSGIAIDKNGKVGIGTTTPNAKLEVNGEIIQTGSTRRGYTHYQGGSAEKLYHYLGRVSSWCGAIGVEGQFESHNTTTRGTGNFDLSFARRGGLKVNGFASGLFGESLDIELYETEEGKATDFGLNLDVYLVTGTYAMTNINISQTPGCGEINTAEITPQEKSETSHDGEEPYYKLSTDGAAMFTDVNGNFGIGTTSPAAKLEVAGSGTRLSGTVYTSSLSQSILGWSNETKFLSEVNVGDYILFSDGQGGIVTAVNSDNSLKIDKSIYLSSGTTATVVSKPAIIVPQNAGFVGIGTSTPSALLEVAGTALATSWDNTSDSRLKKAVETIPSALEKILSLRGVTFEWKQEEFPERNFADGTQIGLIAQEVEEVFPELVSQGEYKSVSYANLVSPLIEAVKELHALYQGHADRLVALEAQNAEQDNHIAHQDERIAHQDELIVQLEVRLAALEAAQ